MSETRAPPVFAAQQADLGQLAERSRLRVLAPRAGVDFASNDYLGLAASGHLTAAAREALDRGVPLGSGGSRLLRGNHPEHEALESAAATLFGCPTALFFGSGYAANVALFATLPQRGDLVVFDALVHASAHEGMRLGRAECVAAPHNDADGFADVIARWRAGGGQGRAGGGKGRVWIAVESLYSMDGDRAPLDALAAIADRHDAVLIIDEAHATGVFGPEGRGLAAALEGRDNVITLHTFGKALGCEGALICGATVVRDFLVNRGRGFIFSTAPSPLMAAVAGRSLELVAAADERRARLQALIAHAETRLAAFSARMPPGRTGSAIMPLILGDDARVMAVADALRRAGFDVRGIRSPTVPVGGARLRIVLTLNATTADVDGLGDALEMVLPS